MMKYNENGIIRNSPIYYLPSHLLSANVVEICCCVLRCAKEQHSWAILWPCSHVDDMCVSLHQCHGYLLSHCTAVQCSAV